MKYLLIAFALLALSCGKDVIKYEEDLSIEVETSYWLPVKVDSFQVTFSGVKQVVDSGPCDTIAQLCSLPSFHSKTTDQNIQVSIRFFARGIFVGSVSRYLSPEEEGNVSIQGQVVLKPDSMAVVLRKAHECKSGTSNCLTDPRNGGRNYRTAKIGAQTWMIENLDYPVEAVYLIKVASYCFNNEEIQCALRGRMYNWYALFDGTISPGVQGICPSGWHLPTDEEWNTLEVTAGLPIADTSVIGDWRGSHASALRGKSELWGTAWETMDAENGTGFSAYPGGVYDGFGASGFLDMEEDASYWTSTEVPKSISGEYDQAIKRKIGLSQQGVRRDRHHKGNAYSLRCVKDSD